MRKVFPPAPRSVTLEGLKQENGQLVTAPTYFFTDNLNIIQEGVRYEIEAPALNIFDEKVSYPVRLFGGKYWVEQADVDKVHELDYVEFSIIDKDDLFGMFALYGLSVENGDFIELNKFVIKDYVKKGNPSNGYFSDLTTNVSAASEIMTGLYRRIAYYSHGGIPITLFVKYYYYK